MNAIPAELPARWEWLRQYPDTLELIQLSGRTVGHWNNYVLIRNRAGAADVWVRCREDGPASWERGRMVPSISPGVYMLYGVDPPLRIRGPIVDAGFEIPNKT